jgi:hypothetical protein
MKTSVNRPIITRSYKKRRFKLYWAYILLPFYYIYLGLKWLWDIFLVNLFCETKWTKWNGIIGPGGRTYSYHEFSWGKLSFIIALIALILVIIYII